MRRPLTKSLPFDVAVSKPCQQQWSGMAGPASRRYCEACKRPVHNFSAMTPGEIERTVAFAGGNLCARVTRREDGSIVMLDQPTAARTNGAGIVLAAALVSAPALGQSTERSAPVAIVTGKVLDVKTSGPSQEAHVIFVRGDTSVLDVTTDSAGEWRATLPPGTYDVIFRTNMLYGARVIAAELHAGEQTFAPVHQQFTYGHLGIENSSTSATMGTLEARIDWRTTILYRIKHPIRYLAYLRRRYL